MSFSKIVFSVCALLIIFAGTFFYPRWQKEKSEAQISWDASGYYWYLPSLIIYKDIKGQGFKDSLIQKYQPTPPGDPQQVFFDEAAGNYVLKYTSGMAIMEAPFFFIAHFLAPHLGYPADGFSPPYQVMIYLGGLLMTLLGLWYLRKLLLLFYSDKVTGVTLFLLVFGTNYLNYCGIDVGMSHCWLFTLYVFILLNTHYYYWQPKRKYALRVGMLIGLLTLTRPTEFIALLIPLLWQIDSLSWKVFKQRAAFILQHKFDWLWALLLGVAIVSIQFFYWKYATGNWLIYTYGEQGFLWLNPLFEQYTFNYETGWLTYTPLMMLAILGLVPFLLNGRNRVAIVAMILFNYYIVCSWGAWDMGGRGMVQGYALLVFPLASFIQFLGQKPILKRIALPIILLLTYFNLWWTYQAHAGGLMGDLPSNRKYFWTTIFRYNLPKDIQKLRDNPDLYLGAVPHPETIGEIDYKEAKDKGYIEINGANPVSGILSFPKPKQEYDWIRAIADVQIEAKEWNVWNMTWFVIRFKKGEQVIKTNYIRVQRFLNDGERKEITVDARTPDAEFDQIEVYFELQDDGQEPCYIRRVKVIGFNEQ